LTAAREGGAAVLRVQDTGIGIAPEMLPHVFDLFRQAKDASAHAQGGLGIGLALVRSLVEMHGGQVSASSPGRGRGSEFVVRLPALPGTPRSRPETSTQRDPKPGQPVRVLVVDDNRVVTESWAVLLKLWGYEVGLAHDGPAAVAAALTQQPQVVLLDIGLPGMNGYEVAQRLRDQPGLEKPLLVALTGHGHEEDRCRSREAGFDHHLVKPVDPEELHDLLTRSRPQQAAEADGPWPKPTRQGLVRPVAPGQARAASDL
jgi:CheY-like chemotaxis protein